MASTFSNLGIELMATGENAGTWGTKTNTNLQIVEKAISGYVEQAVTSGGTTALSITDGDATESTSVARHAVIKLTGTITDNSIVTVPDSVEKVYIVTNGTSGAYTVQFKTASGTGITFGVSEKTTRLVYSDGTNLVDAGFGGSLDLEGRELVLDADGDTSITADTDDQIDIRIAGADDFQFTANTFTAQSGSTIAAQALTATTIVASSTVQGTTITATTAFAPDASDGAALGTSSLEFSDLFLADAAVINLGDDQDVTLTHVADTGVLLNGANVIQFRDSGLTIGSNADGDLDIVSDGTAVDSINIESAGGITLDAGTAGSGVIYEDDGTEMARIHNSSSDVILETKVSDKDFIVKGNDGGSSITAATFDMSDAGTLVLNHDIRIADGGQIGSASDADAIAISSGGVVTFSQAPVFPDGSINIADIDLDGGTDVNAAIADADLFLIDDGAGGTMRKATASRIKTYMGAATGEFSVANLDIDGATDIGAAIVDADLFIIDDGAGGTNRKVTASRLKTYAQTGVSSAADDITAGDAAVTISTSSGNITIDTAAGDADIIFKGTDSSSDITAATFDMSDGGALLLEGGAIDLKNRGSVSNIKFYCESSNAHYTQLQSAAHSDYSGNVTLTLPAATDTLAGIAATQTLTNKTLTTPVIAEIDSGADITLDATADIVLDAAGGNIEFKDAGTLQLTLDMDGTAGAQVIQLGVDSDDLIFKQYDGTTVLTLDDDTSVKVAADLTVGDDLGLISDSAVLTFGADSEITLTHVADSGLTLKHAASGDDKFPTLTLAAGDNDIAVNDKLGVINFQAPDEGTGTDAILVAAGIEAVSEGNFAADNNATKLSFKTAASAAAAETMSLSSTGLLTIADDLMIKDGGTIGVASTNDAITISSAGIVTFKDDILIKDGGTIGAASDADSITIASNGVVTFSQAPVFPDGSLDLADLDIDGGTDIGADLVDADLFIVDDGAGGTNRKVAASRIKTYVGGGTSWQAVKTGDFTAAAGQGVFVNTTSSAITITLPAGSIGDEVSIIDYAGTFDSNACTVTANGSEKIFGSTDDLVVSTERAAFTLVFTDSTQGWLFKND